MLNKQEKIMNNEMPKLYRDEVFKAMFKDNPNVLAKMIADILGIEYEFLYDNIILLDNETPISRLDEKAKRCDFIVRINKNNIINIEINTRASRQVQLRNFMYVTGILNNEFLKGKKYEYKIDLILTKINIDVFKKNKNYKELEDISKCIKVYKVMTDEDTEDKELIDNLKIYKIDVVNSYNLLYNLIKQGEEAPKKLRWAALVYAQSIEKLNYIMEDILDMEEKNQVLHEIERLSEDVYKMTEE